MAVQIGGDIPLSRLSQATWTRARVSVQEGKVAVMHDAPDSGVRGFSVTTYTPDEAEAVGRRLIEAAEEARRGD